MPDDFDPYKSWLSISPEQQPPDHYQLLGINRYEPSIKIIERAVNQRVELLQNLSNGPNVVHAQKLLNEIAAARVCLTDPQKKSAYDRQLQNPAKPVQRNVPTESKPKPAMPESSVPNIQIQDDKKNAYKSNSRSMAALKVKPSKRKSWPTIAITSIGAVVVTGLAVALIIKSTSNSKKADADSNQDVVVDLPSSNVLKKKTYPKIKPPEFAAVPLPAGITKDGLVAWLDATDRKSIKQNRSKRVRWWLDKSGNQNHAGQPDTTKQPTWHENKSKGLPTISFRSSGRQWLDLENESAFDFGKNLTMIYVIDHRSGIAFSKGTASEKNGFSIFKSATTFRAGTNSGKAFQSTANSPKNQLTLAVLTIDGTQKKQAMFRVNGKPGSTQGIADANQFQINNAEPLRIGKRAFKAKPTLSAFYFAGQVGEVLIYRRTLSPAEIEKIEKYLLQKWKL